ncbi:MAG: glycosyltransferase family 2 protein [Flavobacteriales bacterium]
MLSILIPVYNYDVTELVTELSKQCVAMRIQFEIICLDDASTQNCSPAIDLDHFGWVQTNENLGRAGARNKLVSLARYDVLLFLDADMKVIEPDFIANYFKYAKENSVVCGGFVYTNVKPENHYLLRWNYGRKYEVKIASERAEEPFGSFMTGNFLALKSVMVSHLFDESLLIYGHEDTLFGKALLEAAVKIKHIDNPALHDGLETNEKFIEKTKEGMKSLSQLYASGKITRHYSGVIKLYENLRLMQLLTVTYTLIEILESWMGKEIKSKGKKLWLFQLLKLKWFVELQK